MTVPDFHIDASHEAGFETQGDYTVSWKWEEDDVDPLTHLKDYDESIFGRFAYSPNANRYGEANIRPGGFDGNAERLDRYHPGSSQGDYIGLWWQPPDPKGGAAARGTPEFDEMRRYILDILTFGYMGLNVDVVRVMPECQCCGHAENRTAHASLWGIEWIADAEYKSAVMADLVSECLSELED
jgi:hypothetical protein